MFLYVKMNIGSTPRGRRGKQCMLLDEIWSLNDKQLVALFAEPASNELTKNFAYTCALMPEKCAAIFTSFGSELKARESVKEHLLDHLRELVSRSRGIRCGLRGVDELRSLCTGLFLFLDNREIRKSRELKDYRCYFRKKTESGKCHRIYLVGDYLQFVKNCNY